MCVSPRVVVWFRGTEWGRGCVGCVECVAVACRLRLGLVQVPAHESRVILLVAVLQVLYVSRHPLHPLHTQQAPVAVLHWATLVIEEQATGADYTHTERTHTELLMSHVLHDLLTLILMRYVERREACLGLKDSVKGKKELNLESATLLGKPIHIKASMIFGYYSNPSPSSTGRVCRALVKMDEASEAPFKHSFDRAERDEARRVL